MFIASVVCFLRDTKPDLPTLRTPLGVIDYDNLTYGDISSTIRSEGIKICRDLKIQSQASKSKAKYEVRNICT